MESDIGNRDKLGRVDAGDVLKHKNRNTSYPKQCVTVTEYRKQQASDRDAQHIRYEIM